MIGIRAAILVSATALLAAACGPTTTAQTAKGDHVVFVAISTPGGPEVRMVDTRTHALAGRLPLGVPSADWRDYYVVSGSELEDLDPLTGAVQRALVLPAGYRLPIVTAGGMPGGLSPNGRRLVLQQQSGGASHLMVVDTSFTVAPVRIDLAGDFEFDAVSNDGARLYLIQRAAGGHYFVRQYLIGSGLDPNVIFDKADGGAAMSGLRLMGVASPSGDWLYSVYARKDQSAFVHELNLEAPFALCVDLAGPGYGASPSAMRWSLAMSQDGGRLFATNGGLGLVMEVTSPSGSEPGVARTVRLSGDTSGGALLTADQKQLIVAGAGGLRWLDVSSLHPVATSLSSWNVAGMALSSDAGFLYAVSGSGQIAQVTLSDRSIVTFDAGMRGAISVMRAQLVS